MGASRLERYRLRASCRPEWLPGRPTRVVRECLKYASGPAQVEIREASRPGYEPKICRGVMITAQAVTRFTSGRAEVFDAGVGRVAEAEGVEPACSPHSPAGILNRHVARIGSGLDQCTAHKKRITLTAIDGLTDAIRAAVAEFLEAQSVHVGLFTFRSVFSEGALRRSPSGARRESASRADLRGIEIAPIAGEQPAEFDTTAAEVRHKHKGRRRIWL